MPQPEHQIVGRVREWSGGWAARRAEEGREPAVCSVHSLPPTPFIYTWRPAAAAAAAAAHSGWPAGCQRPNRGRRTDRCGWSSLPHTSRLQGKRSSSGVSQSISWFCFTSLAAAPRNQHKRLAQNVPQPQQPQQRWQPPGYTHPPTHPPPTHLSRKGRPS
jgi:hypothetical protein